MVRGQLHSVIRDLRRALRREDSAGVSDAELLERFVRDRDEAAFELLAWRHGGMVLGLCGRVLRDASAAEDAFQATFLVLARKASTISRREAVGSWLYKVAYRISLTARSEAARRAGREEPLGCLTPVASTPEPSSLASQGELRGLLDEAVGHLPDKLRGPVILCYFEGKTNEEAARELDCPVGTILSRLSRAREWLRLRLTRRGVALQASSMAMVLASSAASAAVPAPLLAATVQAAMGLATGTALVGGVSAKAVFLTEGVLKAMWMTKMKVALALVLAASVIGGAGAALAWQARANPPVALAGRAGGQPAGRAEEHVRAEEPGKLTAADFEKLHEEFRMPDRGMWAIPWKLSIQEARELAVKTRKPLLVWMQDGSPLGCT